MAIESQIAARKKLADEQISREAQGLKGEARFRVTERVYTAQNYSPIMNVLSGLSFFVVLPFLIAALLLFNANTALSGVPFFLISDLMAPDRLLFGANLLPYIMSAVTIADAFFRFGTDRKAFFSFMIIAVVLLVIVYNLASALLLYWTTSNLMAFSSAARNAPGSQRTDERRRQ